MNYTRARRVRCCTSLAVIVSCFLLLSPGTGRAFDEDWSDRVEQMLDDGETDAALSLLQQVRDQVVPYNDAYARVTALRQLGELYAEADRPALSRDSFALAMKEALRLELPYQQLTEAVTVFRAQREADASAPLGAHLQSMLDARLLPQLGEQPGQVNLKHFIACFNKSATGGQIAQLLMQIRDLPQAAWRQTMERALAKMTFSPLQGEMIDGEMLHPPFEADSFERLRWYMLLAKLYNHEPYLARSQVYLAQAKQQLDAVPKEERTEARRFLKKATKQL